MSSARSTRRVRIAVLGGGASGSLLVRALADAGVAGSIVLVDDGSSPIDDRIWASWRALHEGPDPAVSRCWRRLAVATPRGELELGLRAHRYVAVRGRDLRAATDSALSQLDGTRRTEHAVSLHEDGDHAVVTTDEGLLVADLVFDSLGLLPGVAEAPTASMSFEGWEIETDEPVIDDGRVLLMDFREPHLHARRDADTRDVVERDDRRGRVDAAETVDGPGGVAFVYTLPLSPTRALVEHTRFGARQSSASPALSAYLDESIGAGRYRVARRECGVLPLRPSVARPRTAHCLSIGTEAGMVKASTGYGYGLMRRDAACLARELGDGLPPRGLRRRAHREVMDAVFLRLAAGDPAKLVESLDALFSRNSADLVLRFLDETATAREEARLVSSLPVRPFVGSALGALIGRDPHRVLD